MVNKDIKKIKNSVSSNKAQEKQIYKSKKESQQLNFSVVLKKKFSAKDKKVSDRRGFSRNYKKTLPKVKRSFHFKHFFKVPLHRGLIKNSNGEIIRKVFTKKINLNKIQGIHTFNQSAEVNLIKVLQTPNTLQLKDSLYLLLKTLKNAKKKTLTSSKEENSLDPLGQLCIGLEKSGFYVSIVEWKKNHNLSFLKVKTNKKLCDVFLRSSMVENCTSKKLPTANSLISIKSPYQSFQKKSKKVSSSLVKRKTPGLTSRKGFVHLKKNYSYIMESRLSLYMSIYKKKYTKLFRIMKNNKLKFRRLFFDFQIKQLRHTFRMKKRYKLYRSLTWKRKKKKNRKKVGLFYFLRRRPRMLFRFYVPRHLEINYKTFSLAHLGELDLPSVNSRISFWLNLRRLLTSLAI